MPLDLTPTAAERATLDKLWARGTAFLGCPIAILGGAMSWVSERHLVSAISNAGGFGVIACGSMTPDLLAAEIAATKAMTEAGLKYAAGTPPKEGSPAANEVAAGIIHMEGSSEDEKAKVKDHVKEAKLGGEK